MNTTSKFFYLFMTFHVWMKNEDKILFQDAPLYEDSFPIVWKPVSNFLEC